MLRTLTRGFSTSRLRCAGNPSEMAHFAELAQSWWDPSGPQRILHKMNLMRMDFIRDILEANKAGSPGVSRDLFPEGSLPDQPFAQDLDVLDIGCGGGLLCESLARQPFVKSVLGIDVTPEVLAVAREHQTVDPALTKLSYAQTAVEELDTSRKFDLITMFEVIEHVDDPAETLKTALGHVKPGGWIFLSTINRTALSAFTTIFVAEDLLRIVPKGTHTFSKYINEPELKSFIEKQPGWQVAASEGCIYVPTVGWERFSGRSTGMSGQALNFIIGKDGGNYLLAARKAL